jgi:hypothetical protein
MKPLIKFLNKIDRVNRFLISNISNNILYCIIDNQLNIYYAFNSKNVIDFDSKSIYVVNNYLFSGKNFFYNPINNQICKINKLDGYYYMNIYCDYCLIFTNTNDRYILYSLANDEIISTIPFFEDSSICLLLENCFIVRGKNFYSCYDIKSIKKLWQHSFSDLLPPIQTASDLFQNGNMIVHNGYLYFSLFENNRHLNTATVCIEIETGKIVNIYKGFSGNLTLFGNKIAVAGGQTVEILNTKTSEIIIKNYTSLLMPERLNIGWNSFKITEEGLMYFMANGIGMDSDIGIIDLNTDELLWLHALNPDKETYNISARDFKVDGNRLYVHCSDNTLHIFEKE